MLNGLKHHEGTVVKERSCFCQGCQNDNVFMVQQEI